MPAEKRVLIADPASAYGLRLSKALAEESGIRVVGILSDLQDVPRFTQQQNATVVMLSAERLYGVVPIMQQLKAIPGVKVIAMNGSGKFRTELRGAGADDFFVKPENPDGPDFKSAITSLSNTIRAGVALPAPSKHSPTRMPPASMAGLANAVSQPEKKPMLSGAGLRNLAKISPATLPRAVVDSLRTGFKGIIALGASMGGTEATLAVLQRLPGNMPGIVIVQHMPPLFTQIYAERVDRETRLNVKEAQDGDEVKPGQALIAPGDKQMRVINAGGKVTVSVKAGPRVSGHCPSVDVLFESVAQAMGANAIGIILTGMGSDGAKGLTAMRRRGAYTIGQDEATSVVYGMPRVAFEMGGVTQQAGLLEIPEALVRNLQKR